MGTPSDCTDLALPHQILHGAADVLGPCQVEPAEVKLEEVDVLRAKELQGLLASPPDVGGVAILTGCFARLLDLGVAGLGGDDNLAPHVTERGGDKSSLCRTRRHQRCRRT